MIERILIKDSTIFDEVVLNPHSGFNVISGVSGSGKSVLMESILALFGFKDSNASLIECEISGIDLEDCGILSDEDMILSVVKKDKTKYFINNQSSSKKRVRDFFGSYLHYIHSNSTTELDNVLHLFDLIISKKDSHFSNLIASYKTSYSDFISFKNELDRLRDDEKRVNELKELISFEINQIEDISPKIGEYENLMELKKDLSKKEKMLEKIVSIKATTDGFSKLISTLESIPNIPSYSDVLMEIDAVIRSEEDRLLAIDTNDIENILNRIELLSKLIYKYGSIEESLEHLDKKKQELEYYENISFNKQNLESKVKDLCHFLKDMAYDISKIRASYLSFFVERINHYCECLMLNQAKISLNVKDFGSDGIDLLELRLGDSTIATLSSGEFNRLKLALLCISVECGKKSGIIILDEIDANLSGGESDGVAKVLSILSASYQIFSISHQAHMPSFANHHYLVKKIDGKSSVVLLDKEGRVQEIARMISGKTITNEALLFAREKLQHIR